MFGLNLKYMNSKQCSTKEVRTTINYWDNETNVKSSNENLEENNASTFLYEADPNCKHSIIGDWNGLRCTNCSGWYCY